ncbi:MAG: hypothetical protein V1746_03815 [bacterium]
MFKFNLTQSYGNAAQARVRGFVDGAWLFDLLDANDNLVQGSCTAEGTSVQELTDITAANAQADIQAKLGT